MTYKLSIYQNRLQSHHLFVSVQQIASHLQFPVMNVKVVFTSEHISSIFTHCNYGIKSTISVCMSSTVITTNLNGDVYSLNLNGKHNVAWKEANVQYTLITVTPSEKSQLSNNSRGVETKNLNDLAFPVLILLSKAIICLFLYNKLPVISSFPL
jgi:hypothetical protein